MASVCLFLLLWYSIEHIQSESPLSNQHRLSYVQLSFRLFRSQCFRILNSYTLTQSAALLTRFNVDAVLWHLSISTKLIRVSPLNVNRNLWARQELKTLLQFVNHLNDKLFTNLLGRFSFLFIARWNLFYFILFRSYFRCVDFQLIGKHLIWL